MAEHRMILYSLRELQEILKDELARNPFLAGGAHDRPRDPPPPAPDPEAEADGDEPA